MADTKILCLLTTLLGIKPMASMLMDALDSVPGIEPTYLLFDNDDDIKYPAPWWTRVTGPWMGRSIARQKAQPLLGQRFDLLLVNAWELVIFFQDIASRLPAAAMMDGVPATVDSQLRQRGANGWKRWLSHQFHHRSFAKAVREFDIFLPLGSDCAASLQHDYGVDPQRCFVTLAPQHLDNWTPRARANASPFRLLFVGNDFARKGGDFLLRLYSEHLAGDCTLTIASNDPAVAERKLPPGVEWLRGFNRDQLTPVFRASDVFVFPTRQDYMPQVLAEALAAGLPCMANDIGGIRDLVHPGATGFLMSPQAPAEQWAAHLNRLRLNPAELTRMSAAARRFAEENLSFHRFQPLIAQVIERLRQPDHQA